MRVIVFSTLAAARTARNALDTKLGLPKPGVNAFDWKIPAQLPCYLGSDAGVYNLNGRVCELIVRSKYGTTDDWAAMDDYLRKKWNL